MRFGVYLCNYGNEVSASSLAELAMEAENAGWDGFFIWDHILRLIDQTNVVDPWIALTAVAVKTKSIRFGTTLTPVPRRRPWHLARETTTLDVLSNGRLILSVGLGDPPDVDFAYFGEDPDNRVRAEKLDEGLDILAGLWSGKPFGYQGKHYHMEEVKFLPTPTQKPRIPIWVGGFWPNKGPFRRAARWDGVLPIVLHEGVIMDTGERDYYTRPSELQEIMDYIHARRTDTTPYDAAIIGSRRGLGKTLQETKQGLMELEIAGATWWLQSMHKQRNSFEELRLAIREGPPG